MKTSLILTLIVRILMSILPLVRDFFTANDQEEQIAALDRAIEKDVS